jgi:hypothetical protein
MIIQCKSGAHVVVGECLWVPGVYLAGGTSWSTGVILDPEALDQLRAELDRVAALIADRQQARKRKIA